MAAYNIVRFRVKPGKEADFEKHQRGLEAERMRGFRKGAVINAGDGTYCFIGEWDDYASIVAARPQMIASLDTYRDLLEDLGNGLGVTDAISGPLVVGMGFPGFPE